LDFEQNVKNVFSNYSHRPTTFRTDDRQMTDRRTQRCSISATVWSAKNDHSYTQTHRASITRTSRSQAVASIANRTEGYLPSKRFLLNSISSCFRHIGL